MLKSYFKLAIRNLFKHKMTSFINVFGLSVAVGCCIFGFLFLNRHYTLDEFHENAERIFLIQNTISVKGDVQTWGNSPMPLGPALQNDFPQIKRVVRMNHQSATVRYNDNYFHETIQFADDGFLEMFNFPLMMGDKAALQDRNAIILNEETAQRYFGEENPLGKELIVYFNNTEKAAFFVRGVAAEFPQNASFQFSMLANYEKQFDANLVEAGDWQRLTSATFLELTDHRQVSAIADAGGRYIELQNAADADRPMTAFVMEPLLDMGRNAYKVRGDICSIAVEPSQVISMFLSSFFLLLLACFNYMNIGIVSATLRLKEIGIRKVSGSSRLQLIRQFLTENIILCFITLVLGILLAEYVFVPGFNNAFGVFDLALDITTNTQLWFFLAMLLLITGIGAGAYPAFYISKFQPVTIFGGNQTIKGRRIFTRILLGGNDGFAIIRRPLSGEKLSHRCG